MSLFGRFVNFREKGGPPRFDISIIDQHRSPTLSFLQLTHPLNRLFIVLFYVLVSSLNQSILNFFSIPPHLTMSFATGLLSDVPHDLQQYVASLGPEKIMAILNSATQYNQAVVTDNDSGKKTVKTSKKKGVMDATATKNIRPLNSWIAFRSASEVFELHYLCADIMNRLLSKDFWIVPNDCFPSKTFPTKGNIWLPHHTVAGGSI